MKKEKSFEKLISKMEQLKETEQGKLKGGIAVTNTPLAELAGTNSGVCTNNGPCDDQENTNLCFNNKSNCGEK